MAHSKGCHTTYHHRYHIVWAPKYRFKVLRGEVRLRVREIIRQVCAELGVSIINGVLSSDHVHMFVETPPHVPVSDFVRRAKGRSSRKIWQVFEHIRKRYWGQRFWGRGFFSTTSGNITDDVIINYLDKHTKPIEKASANPNDPTGVSRSVVQLLGLPKPRPAGAGRGWHDQIGRDGVGDGILRVLPSSFGLEQGGPVADSSQP